MIFFCEECGHKQTLLPEQVRNGIVSYTCTACSFSNIYPIPSGKSDPHLSGTTFSNPDDSITPKARQALKKIHASPEVETVFMVHDTSPVRVSRHRATRFSTRDLKTIGTLMVRCRELSDSHYPNTDELHIAVDDSLILCIRISDRFHLAIVLNASPPSKEIRLLGKKAASHLAPTLNIAGEAKEKSGSKLGYQP